MKHRAFLLLLLVLLAACKHDKKVNTTFYYWKTVYKSNKTEASYTNSLHVKKLYVRIMDVNMDVSASSAVPVSPILFNEGLPDTVDIIPVVFIVNNILKDVSKPQLDDLAKKIASFVKSKVKQAGKISYSELQIDCDWTITTRDNYFYLLKQIAKVPEMKGKRLSATLRLHQLKNQHRNGIPPVSSVMLMCYNMGNLRQYGRQNSIIQLSELKKYAGDNIAQYPAHIDIGLPLFSWAVVFRNKQYAGLSKRIKLLDLHKKNQFIFIGDNLYKAIDDMPVYGIAKGDEVRWEDVSLTDLNATAKHLAPLIKQDSLNLIYFHLDENVIKTYTPAQLKATADLLR